MQTKTLICTPIGYFHSPQKDRYAAPKQSELGQESHVGKIVLNEGCNFEHALQDLEGFERIWLLYWFHLNEGWRPKVSTPLGGKKRGVFATRSPHRPNPIGLSSVKLVGIHNRKLYVGAHDLVDGTPILDIKPYVNYADAFPETRQGWLEEMPKLTEFSVEWSELSLKQAAFIEMGCGLHLKWTVEGRLKTNPFPFRSHRIKKTAESSYLLAYKTWRIDYRVEEKDKIIIIDHIHSGYDALTLLGAKPSRWPDVPLHREFIRQFGNPDFVL